MTTKVLEQIEAMRRVLATLSPRAEMMVRLRYGLGGHAPRDVAQIAVEMQASEAEVTEVLEKALRMVGQRIPPRNEGPSN